MPRFFLGGASTIAGGTAFILGEDANHAKVLRIRVGDRLIVCDGNGQDHHCTVKRIAPDAVEAEIFESVPCPAEPNVRVSVLAGLPKGEHADYIVQKCVETGASEIDFFPCQRSVMRLNAESRGKKEQRWQRIAEEAAKQSGRGIIPEVHILDDIAAAFNRAAEHELPFFMYETGERIPFRTVVENAGEFKSAAVITGPEGGFEQYEAELAAHMGIQLVSMGPRIFRCETAPVAAVSAIMYATGNM